MNKIDEQPDTGSHSPGEAVKISSPVAPSVPNSRPIASEAAAVLSMDMRSEQDMSLQVVESKTTSRRAWLRRGVAVASPVVATLVSAPVFGCVALTASAMGSATFASHHPNVTFCVFRGPNFWFNNLSAWPAGTTTVSGSTTTGSGSTIKAVSFMSLFSVPAQVESGITASTTLNDVLGGRFSLLAKYTSAAYLNGGTLNFPLSAPQAVEVYKSYHGGSFSALLVPGWTKAQTEAWLQVLMP